MQKAEAQRSQIQNQPAQRQGRGASLESPQGEQLAQLEAMAEASPQAAAQRSTMDIVANSPYLAAQRTAISAIHNSPNVTAQRRQLDSIAGETAQRAEASIQLSGREGDEFDPGPGQGESAPPTPRPGQSVQAPPPPVEAESLLQDGYSPRAREEQDDTAQLKAAEGALQPKVSQREEAPVKPNNTGLPDNLKSGIESLSGMSMDNVKVHYNSSQPAQLNAHAYAQGTDIHVGPGQERHLPHEAWHVVQQAQGRVQPTMQMKEGVPVNDDAGLEREADVMGARALNMSSPSHSTTGGRSVISLMQRVSLGQGEEAGKKNGSEASDETGTLNFKSAPVIQAKKWSELNNNQKSDAVNMLYMWRTLLPWDKEGKLAINKATEKTVDALLDGILKDVGVDDNLPVARRDLLQAMLDTRNDPALNNKIVFGSNTYTTQGALVNAIREQCGSEINVRQAVNRIDTNSNVSLNTNIKKVSGGKLDSETLLLQQARHASFGMGDDGCALFFTINGSTITLVGIGHHEQNSSKRYRIVWAAVGYPKGSVAFPGG